MIFPLFVYFNLAHMIKESAQAFLKLMLNV